MFLETGLENCKLVGEIGKLMFENSMKSIFETNI
jgi:hypothetical protein